MSIESTHNPAIASRPSDFLIDNSKEQSIFESYSPINDAERLRKLSHLSSEEQAYYLSENVLSHLEEFAGEIQTKVLRGIIKLDGTIQMMGADVSDMAQKSAQNKGCDSREWEEMLGLETISQNILNGANRAIWISPPKADYSFAFTFIADEYDEQLGGVPFREYFPRYQEAKESIETSRNLYSLLVERFSPEESVSPENFTSARDFLRNPIVYGSEHDDDLSFIYQSLGITDQDIQKSEEFRIQLMPKIKPWLDAYIQLVEKMSSLDPKYDKQQLQELNSVGETLFGAMFNTARIVDRQYYKHIDDEYYSHDHKQLAMFDYDLGDDKILYMLAQNMADYQSLTVKGSSCPIAQSSGDIFFNATNNGLSVVDVMSIFGTENVGDCGRAGCRIRYPHFHCPDRDQGGCGMAIRSGKGHDECPNCQLTKEKFAEMSGVRCE